MSEDWASIAAEAAAAIADIGVAMTLEKPATTGPQTPWDTTPAGTKPTFTIYAVPDMERVRDAGGTLIGVTRETLLVSAIDVVPAKADRVFVRGTWREIEEVNAIWMGQADIMYSLTLVA